MKLLKFWETLRRYAILMTVGGAVYYFIELLWRGYSHISMVLVGGICFVLIGLINQQYEWDMCLTSQMVLAGLIITGVELIAGLILNVWLKLDIWDYSDVPYNFMGQICLSYMMLWQWLSVVGILLDDFVRWLIFGEEKPRYKLI